ncbi:MAG: S8 family serine peptidase [Pseudomonadota bacterium]
MFELGLRVFILFVCAGVVWTTFQVAVWTVSPWANWVRSKTTDGFEPAQTVTIAPVDMLEGGAIKNVEGKTIAKQLGHQVDAIKAVLARDLESDYQTLADQGISIVDTTVRGGEVFSAQSGDRITFQAELFSFDIAGLLNYVHGALEKRDSIATMIELGEKRSRVFVEVSPVGGAKTRIIEDTGPSLKAAIDRAACAVAAAYLAKADEYGAMSPEAFCAYQQQLALVQDFIARNARNVRNGLPIDSDGVRQVAEPFEQAPLSTSGAAIVDLILAGLYRLEGRREDAFARLNAARESVPRHPFVLANFDAWQREVETRETASKLIATAVMIGPRTPLDDVYQKLREQEALQAINYPAMLDRVAPHATGSTVKVAILDTGFTPSGAISAPQIADAISVTPDNGAEDALGHGNMSTNLLAALLPFESVEVLPIKIFDAYGSRDSQVLAGFDRAFDNGADVICANFGRAGDVSPLYEMTAEEARQRGTLILAAAGNGSRRGAKQIAPVTVPANTPGIISVGAADGAEWADFSPGPDGVDLVVPSVRIQTTQDGYRFTEMSGTSYGNVVACAMATAARLVAPDLTQEAFLAAANAAATRQGTEGPRIPDAAALIDEVIAGAP